MAGTPTRCWGRSTAGVYAFARRDQGLSVDGIAANLRALAAAIAAG